VLAILHVNGVINMQRDVTPGVLNLQALVGTQPLMLLLYAPPTDARLRWCWQWQSDV